MSNIIKKNSKCTWKCIPFIIYIILSIVTMLMTLIRKMPNNQQNYKASKATILLSQIVSTIFWGGFIAWLCQNCHEGWAWFFIFLPIILGILLIISVGIFVENIMSYKK